MLNYRCISGFFEKFPTPTPFFTKNATPDSVFEIIRPLGLFPNRMRALVELTTRFLSECGKFEVGLTPELKIFWYRRLWNGLVHRVLSRRFNARAGR